ncbi:hypothetical protein PHISP_03513 [Aspergillus sp. HF37]|nr:hypothetical protein PHISP_03513 [Aspergillus sp. HF37]
MLPPCDPAVLQSNPQFSSLYQHLTTSLLNPDGSTRASDTQPARRAAVEDLKGCRIRNAKKQIKKRTLRQLAFDGEGGLPDQHQDTVAVISLYLDSSRQNGKEAGDTLALLAPDIEAFYSSIPAVINPFSEILSSSIASLRMIANAGTKTTPVQSSESSRPRPRARQSASNTATPLSSQLSARVRSLRETQLVELPASRRQMTLTAAEVLATRAQVLEQTVVLLERAKHGALARATKAKAEHLATVAQGMEGKLNVTKFDVIAQIYSPETIAALDRYRQHLGDVRERLEERQELVSQELKAYDAQGRSCQETGSMAEIVQRYGKLAREVEAVKVELRRLE